MQTFLQLLRWNIRVLISSGGPIPRGIACKNSQPIMIFVTSVNPKTIKNFSLNVTQRYHNFNEQIILKLYDGYHTSIPRSSLNASQDYQD